MQVLLMFKLTAYTDFWICALLQIT